MHISFMCDENGSNIGPDGITRDITEIKKVEAENTRQNVLLVSLVDSNKLLEKSSLRGKTIDLILKTRK